MNEENQKTLEAYEHGLDAYNAASLPDVVGSLKEWVDASLAMIPQGAHILEIGSAHGRDADYMEALGYYVDRTDAANSFVEYMKQNGKDARLLNALSDDLGNDYDMIYASSVLLHFTTSQVASLLDKVHESLKPEGIFSFCVKIGEGSVWSEAKLNSPRFFNFWSEAELRELLADAKFTVAYWKEGSTGHDNSDWYHVIVRK